MNEFYVWQQWFTYSEMIFYILFIFWFFFVGGYSLELEFVNDLNIWMFCSHVFKSCWSGFKCFFTQCKKIKDWREFVKVLETKEICEERENFCLHTEYKSEWIELTPPLFTWNSTNKKGVMPFENECLYMVFSKLNACQSKHHIIYWLFSFNPDAIVYTEFYSVSKAFCNVSECYIHSFLCLKVQIPSTQVKTDTCHW